MQLIITDDGVIVRKFNSASNPDHISEPIYDVDSRAMPYLEAIEAAISYYCQKYNEFDGMVGILHNFISV
jgi:hypothetical protein